jgi:hypothetical protein
MSRQFSYPTVTEIRRLAPEPAGLSTPPAAPSQRAIVEASLFHCPGADRRAA